MPDPFFKRLVQPTVQQLFPIAYKLTNSGIPYVMV